MIYIHKLGRLPMNLADVKNYLLPDSEEELVPWESGHSYVAGGTWLYSEPQPDVDTVIDLMSLNWDPVQITDKGLEIASTCTIRQLIDFDCPKEWRASSLIKRCAEALSASFKIFNAATVGGNICMSLPAGAMISFATALHANYSIISQDKNNRQIPAMKFHFGNQKNVLKPGEILRNIQIEKSWLQREALIEYRALTPIGRSAALIIATKAAESKAVEFTITASVVRPYQIAFDDVPTKEQLSDAIQSTIPQETYFDDQHGDVFYRQEMTYYLSEVLRKKLTSNA